MVLYYPSEETPGYNGATYIGIKAMIRYFLGPRQPGQVRISVSVITTFTATRRSETTTKQKVQQLVCKSRNVTYRSIPFIVIGRITCTLFHLRANYEPGQKCERNK